ncbi:hypothetical protein HDK77DRAFT_123344 [Phyllosticta capitalensis]
MPKTSEHHVPLRLNPLIPPINYEAPVPPPHTPKAHEYEQTPPDKRPLPSRPSLENLPRSAVNAGTKGTSAKEPSKQPSHSRPMNQAPPWSMSGITPWSTGARPLSDIREITEPSLAELTHSKPLPDTPKSVTTELRRKCSLSRKGSLLSRKGSLTRKTSLKSAPSPADSYHERRGRHSTPVRTPVSDHSSIYSIPIGSVPPRSSSRNRGRRAVSLPRVSSLGPPPAPPRGLGFTIPNRGQSRSPVREYASRYDPVSSDVVQTVPPRTFGRVSSGEVLEFPTHRHPRVAVELQIGAPLFVGGGSLEGNVKITVEDVDRTRHKRALYISRISIDLLGAEEMCIGKRDIFLNLATELIDPDNPPPLNMVESQKPCSPTDPFWLMKPSVTTMPFSLSMPLDVGPPPFQSKLAQIRYVLCATLLIRDKGTQYLVRSSQDVSVLSVYDPEKALMSLPSPLTASDEYTKPRGSALEIVRVTAGLHRQVWVSGTTIFVDVHIVNNTRKRIKKLELNLERDILCYNHTAASTREKSASQARIFDNNERTMLNKTTIKPGTHGWSGVAPHSTDMRTCGLELPRGHATVKCGKFFEVRYFLNIAVSGTHSKLVTVQLPIVLIHMNSLDVVPNSVAQVAAAIEEKRIGDRGRRPSSREPSRRPSISVPGRAFAAPRMQSLDRMRREVDDLQEIEQILQHSPRKYKIGVQTHPDGGKERVIRRVQSAAGGISQQPSTRVNGHKPKPDNNSLNSSLGLGYGYGHGYSVYSNPTAYANEYTALIHGGTAAMVSSENDLPSQRYNQPHFPPASSTATLPNPQTNPAAFVTPPNPANPRAGTRNPRIVLEQSESLESMRQRLRHVKSNETTRSQQSQGGAGDPSNPHPRIGLGLQRSLSHGGHSRSGSSGSYAGGGGGSECGNEAAKGQHHSSSSEQESTHLALSAGRLPQRRAEPWACV